jgi:hypothetical protein
MVVISFNSTIADSLASCCALLARPLAALGVPRRNKPTAYTGTQMDIVSKFSSVIFLPYAAAFRL